MKPAYSRFWKVITALSIICGSTLSAKAENDRGFYVRTSFGSSELEGDSPYSSEWTDTWDLGIGYQWYDWLSFEISRFDNSRTILDTGIWCYHCFPILREAIEILPFPSAQYVDLEGFDFAIKIQAPINERVSIFTRQIVRDSEIVTENIYLSGIEIFSLREYSETDYYYSLGVEFQPSKSEKFTAGVEFLSGKALDFTNESISLFTTYRF